MDKGISKKEQGNQVRRKPDTNGNSQPPVPVEVIEVPVDQKVVLMQPEASPPPKSPAEERRDFWQVHGLMLYFIVLLFLAFWFFLLLLAFGAMLYSVLLYRSPRIKASPPEPPEEPG